MDVGYVDEAVELLEKANADLEPELLTGEHARELMAAYARAEKLVTFGIAALTRKLSEPGEVARVTGSSVGKARDVVQTGEAMASSAELDLAMRNGDISLDQAVQIAAAEGSAPGSAGHLVAVAQTQPFHVLKDEARRIKLAAEQHRDLADRQRAARTARSHTDELGMLRISMDLQPHVGAPIVARAEAEAQRLRSKAKAAGKEEPLERHLADAYAALLSGSGKGRAKRPELVVLVSHEVVKRGWRDVRRGEHCKIPGIGPVSPQVAKEIAHDAFLNGVFYDGKDLRHLRRWSRSIPIEVATALELGPPPDFDGMKCVDCGKRFRTQNDHVEPVVAGGPSSNDNVEPRCPACHKAKTERDRRAGKLKPP